MKLRILSVLLIFLVIGYGCSEDDELFIQEEISFVYADESKLLDSGCIDPNDDYMLLLTVFSNKTDSFPMQVGYTLNGALYSVTFIGNGSKTIPVSLVEGVNIAQIVSNGAENIVNVISQGDFELVD